MRRRYSHFLEWNNEDLQNGFLDRAVVCRDNNKLRHSGRLVRARSWILSHSYELVSFSTNLTIWSYL